MGRTLKTPALAPDLLQELPRSLHFIAPRWLFLLPRPGVLMLADCTVVQRALVPPHLRDVPPPTAPRPAPPGRPLQLVVQPRPSADARLARSPPPLRAAHGLGGSRPPVTPGPSRGIPWATVSRETEPAPATDTGYETHLCGRLWGPCTSPTTTGQMHWPDALPRPALGFVGLDLRGQGKRSSGVQGGGA